MTLHRVRRRGSCLVLVTALFIAPVTMGPATGPAQAHTCTGAETAACGDCKVGGHYHASADGALYCRSYSAADATDVCIPGPAVDPTTVCAVDTDLRISKELVALMGGMLALLGAVLLRRKRPWWFSD